MRKSIFTIAILALSFLNVNATEVTTTSNNLEITTSISRENIVEVFDWSVKTTSGNPSYSDYNMHNEANFIERSEGNPELKIAQDYFNNKNYQKASETFAKIENLTNPEIQLYYAISLIETDDYSKSNILLENISQGISVYKEEAIWYLALSSLKQKKYDESKKYLQQITEDSEKYSQAQKLLNDLE